MHLRNLVRRPTSQQSIPQAQSSQPRIETLSSSKALPVAYKTGSKTAAADDGATEFNACYKELEGEFEDAVEFGRFGSPSDDPQSAQILDLRNR